MKILLHISYLLFACNTLFAQQMSVKSFCKLEMDIEARVTAPRKDQNGETAALIKIVTAEKCFVFDIGMMGVVDSEQKTGEVWVWIPKGTIKLTIKHPQLGVLRDYLFPERIEEATTYEMILISGCEIVAGVNKHITLAPIPIYGALEVSANVVDAKVYLNGKDVGITSNIINKIFTGTYNIEVWKYGYISYEGRVTINEGKITAHSVSLTKNPIVTNVTIDITSTHSIQVFDRNVGTRVPHGGVALNYTNDTTHVDHKNSLFKGDYYAWDKAKTACPNGWRLPTKDELDVIKSKMKFSNRAAYLEDSSGKRCYFPSSGGSYINSSGEEAFITSSIDGHYWSSTLNTKYETSEEVWYLDVLTNRSHVTYGYTSYGYSVRCVKTVPSSEPTSILASVQTSIPSSSNTKGYVTIGNIQVYDRNVGTNVPQGGVALNYTNDKMHPDHKNSLFKGDYYTWEEAKTVCPSGWRLPTLPELDVIADAMQFSDRKAYLEESSGDRCYFPLSASDNPSRLNGGYLSSEEGTNTDWSGGDYAWTLRVGSYHNKSINDSRVTRTYSHSTGYFVRCVKIVTSSEPTSIPSSSNANGYFIIDNIQVYDRNVGANVPQGGVALNYTNDTTHADHKNSLFKGDYYTWAEAKTVCPSGWRLPSKADLVAIQSKLKLSDGAAYLEDSSGNRCYFPLSGRLDYPFYWGNYWSSTEHESYYDDNAWYLYVDATIHSSVGEYYSIESHSLSVRCVKTVP